MSQRSRWLGAPALKIRMTDFAFARGFVGPARRRSQSDQKSASALAPPACNNSRRVTGGLGSAVDRAMAGGSWPAAGVRRAGFSIKHTPSGGFGNAERRFAKD